MDNPQCGVAVPHFRHQDAYGPDVVDLGEIDALAAHLPPDAVDMLGAACQLGVDAGATQFLAQFPQHFLYVALTVETLLVQLPGDLLVSGLVQVAEREVLQLPLDMPDAQAVGQRRVDVEHLPGHPHALFIGGVLYGT